MNKKEIKKMLKSKGNIVFYIGFMITTAYNLFFTNNLGDNTVIVNIFSLILGSPLYFICSSMFYFTVIYMPFCVMLKQMGIDVSMLWYFMLPHKKNKEKKEEEI